MLALFVKRSRYTGIGVEMVDSRFDDALLPGGRGISIYMLVSDFLSAQFHHHLRVRCPHRIETASAWTAPLRMDATLLCIGVPHEHRPYALMASSHVLILTLFNNKFLSLRVWKEKSEPANPELGKNQLVRRMKADEQRVRVVGQ